jgi:nucleotide-binding universal stress UspA family protein
VGRIVVGVDGSEGAVQALRFAIEEARIRGSGLRAVSAWHVPPAVYGAGWAPASTDLDEFRKLAEASLRESVEEAGATAAGVEVTPVVREGNPVDVLLEESEGADLLVLGTRGMGGFKGLLLGSVSHQCANHASCPVVIVPTKSHG